MTTARLRPLLLALLGACLPLASRADSPPAPKLADQPVRFEVKSYTVEGAPRLDQASEAAALGWLPGPARSMADLQKAQHALQLAYQQHGLRSVYVLLPAQEISDGKVRFVIVQGKTGKVTVEGNKWFSQAAIRRTLSTLKEGQPLDAGRLSQNVALANDNPALQMVVLLNARGKEGNIDAKVKVDDDRPLRVLTTLDNSGNATTGAHRLGVAVQHSNLFDRGHVASLAYTTAPDSPHGVEVGIYSLGYRIPLYPSDSVEAVYGHSNVGIPSGTPALGGVLGLTGKGSVLDLNWNHYLPRVGEYSAHLSTSAGSQDIGQGCTGLAGSGVAGCVSYRTLPLGLAYNGKWEPPNHTMSFSLGLRANAGGSSSASLTKATGREVARHFKLWQGNATLTQQLGQWQLQFNSQLQWTQAALPTSEQLGLAGASAVRGYEERALATDQGAVLQSELHTPPLKLYPGALDLLAFFDYAHGHNYNADVGSTRTVTLSSYGCGLRYQYQKNVIWRLDLAKPRRSEDEPTGARVHFTLTIGY